MISNEIIRAAEGQCDWHRADHGFRTMFLGGEIFELELVTAPEEVKQNPNYFREVLNWTAVLHDREMPMTDKYDFTHGKKAADRVDEIIGEAVSPEGRELIKFLCEFHVPDDSEITGLTDTQRWLLSVFKDADALDRVRFDNGDTLDKSHLRFGSSRELIPQAQELWERTKQGLDSPQAAFDAVFGNRVE
ncbi:MAG: hypothetical protein V1810_03750 [Candidatus Beckwithbacteria bacterium]